ncbi:Phosphatidylserine/phosphatidylglycerophosphate/cardiolipin synthase [Marinospirillum celere]|uniref:Phosphatidylserine/phosphatidylglycerophosphate/cardiolipin synthase n=1 Tax=Marinospirillum celere TaxID=1122252 RepID=A0A1I1GXR1_9GAMM|nr:phospholipase D-like domain-containing protein [Marinospirillum celere]SFC16062.1 Phosphatidylserine/phosphatidylglycerophosphate/cardiolipin synthase [Marinospirillum celere]
MAKHFSWRAGNQLQLLVQGQEFFPAMLTEIDQATEYILLEVYLVESGQQTQLWIQHLVAASLRGVRVALLLDSFGAAQLNDDERLQLLAAGVRINWFNPLHWRKVSRNLMRDHRKLLLVDGRIAFTGGFGLTDDFAGSEAAWQEVVVRIEGPCVADWQTLFWRTWHQARGRKLELLACSPPALYRQGGEGRLVYGQGLYLHAIKLSLLRNIQQAKQQIWLATPYFAPSRRLRRALMAAARRGVEVHLLLPGPETDHPPVRYAGQRFYQKLLAAGVQIYEYQPSFLHAKVSLCDDWASVGSCNFDHWGLHWNLEANQEVLDAAFAEQVESWFQECRAQSLWLDAELWKRRSRRQKIREYFWGLLDEVIQRFKSPS